MRVLLDHVTIGARTLEEGAAYLRDQLGVDLPPGGKHADMGTHNCVARIGEGVFLELIAIDPEAAPPPRPRWFGLDDPRVIARLATGPAPVGWVSRCEALDAVINRSPVELGPPLAMSRGARSWRITVPESGVTAFDGLMPAVIEWSEGPHPSAAMGAADAVLSGITLRHPEAARLGDALECLGVGPLARVEAGAGPEMRFTFRRPDGSMRTIV